MHFVHLNKHRAQIPSELVFQLSSKGHLSGLISPAFSSIQTSSLPTRLGIPSRSLFPAKNNSTLKRQVRNWFTSPNEGCVLKDAEFSTCVTQDLWLTDQAMSVRRGTSHWLSATASLQGSSNFFFF